MANLDDRAKIEELDRSNLLGSIEALGSQIKQAWEETKLVKIPQDFAKVSNVCFCGMGGSALGAHILLSTSNDFSLPSVIVNDYQIPAFVGENSLVLVSSYSGNTKETLEAYRLAKIKRAKILGLTTGGTLAEHLKNDSYPGLVFEPKFNPCGQPRMGLGYSIMGILGLFKNIGLIQFSDIWVEKILIAVSHCQERFNLAIPKENNLAKKLALVGFGKIIIALGAEHLAGNTHAAANQINENGKILAFWSILPEANHHLIEGFLNPKDKKAVALFLNSKLYSDEIRKRVEITKEIAQKNGLSVAEFQTNGDGKIEDSFETLVFSSWLSFYLAILNDLDPTPIPNVDYLKEKLK